MPSTNTRLRAQIHNAHARPRRIAASAVALSILLSISPATSVLAAEIEEASETALINRALETVGQSVAKIEVPDPSVTVIGETAALETVVGEITLAPLDPEDAQIRVREDGAQALAVLYEGEEETAFSLTMPSDIVVVPNEGALDLVLMSDSASIAVGQIQKPWAIDATGDPVETSYSFENGVITQNIDTDGVVYPVVADPLITVGLWNAPYGPGFYLNLTGLTLKTTASAVLAVGGGSLITVCTASKLPVAIAKIAKVACFVGGSVTVRALLSLIVKISSSKTIANSSCYQTLLGSGKVFVRTSPANCA